RCVLAARHARGFTLVTQEPYMNEPTLTDTELEAAPAQAPSSVRVTRDMMLARIRDVTYTVLLNTTVTICNITLDNGYSVRGESACVDPANFDAQIGQKLAYDNAFRKLWPLFGFALAERRHAALLRGMRIE